jgi:hypothetical protein
MMLDTLTVVADISGSVATVYRVPGWLGTS